LSSAELTVFEFYELACGFDSDLLEQFEEYDGRNVTEYGSQ